jgi:hypothetical protein
MSLRVAARLLLDEFLVTFDVWEETLYMDAHYVYFNVFEFRSPFQNIEVEWYQNF